MQESFADFHLLFFWSDPILQICQTSISFGHLIHKWTWSNTLATAGLSYDCNLTWKGLPCPKKRDALKMLVNFVETDVN